MATNYIADGNTMDYTNGSGSTINSGDPVAVGEMIGVAHSDIPNGADGVLHTTGVFELPKKSADIIAMGDQLYLSSGEITKTKGGVAAGRAWAPAGNSTTSVWIKINDNSAPVT